MKETIMMIHGMCTGPWIWGNYRSFFENKGYRCMCPTLRFHDMNPQDEPDPKLGSTSLLNYARDIETAIRKLDTIPILMGHSMGGLIAQILGSRGLAKAIILLNTAPPRGIMASEPTTIKVISSVLVKWGFWKTPIRPSFEEATGSLIHLLSPDLQKELYGKFVYESGLAAFEIVFWLFDRNRAAHVDEATITCPVLVVAGSEDRVYTPAISQQVAEKYMNVSTYKEFPNHSHWIVGDPNWREIALYVSQWLENALPRNS